MTHRTTHDFGNLYWRLHWGDGYGFNHLLETKWAGVPFDEICDPGDLGTPLLHSLTIDLATWEWVVREYQPNFNILDKHRRNLLGFGMQSASTVLWFLQRGVNPNNHDIYGNSPIMNYVGWKCGEQVEHLLVWGASLKEADKKVESMNRYERTSGSYVHMRSIVQDFVVMRTHCERAVVALLYCGKGRIHRDLVPVIGRMVWATRRTREIWEMKPRKK